MPFPKFEPIKFRSCDVVRTFEQFKRSAGSYSKTFSDVTDIGKYVEKFIQSNSRLGKQLRSKDFAAEQIWFELTPLIVKSSAPTKSMRHELELAKGLGHVAIRPNDAIEGTYYHYELFVPIPDDMLSLGSEKDLLKEHVTLVDNTIDSDFRQDLLELKPIGIVTWMYGLEGSWMVYSYSVKDDPSAVWSSPLVDAPYNETQPFLATKGGEFVILEDDRDPQSTKELMDVKRRIENRVKGIAGLQIEEHKVIQVDMRWVIAHAISTGAIYRNYSFERMKTAFGESIPKLTIYEKDLKGSELLKYMTEIVKEPTYRFDIENIRRYTIRPK